MNKKLVKVLALYLFSSTCFACTSNIENILDGGTPMINSSSALITDVKATTYFLGWNNVGDTTIKVKADKDVLPALSNKKVDLKNISANELSNLEGGFRMLSIGGSLSAGFRDGGLYREAQLTAFPNLVARQMGVTFNQPLFDATDGNGSGYKALVSTEPIASFKMVTNNLGYEDNTKADKLKAFKGNKNDQYAFPGLGVHLGPYRDDNMGPKFSDRIFINAKKETEYVRLLVEKEACDFFIFDLGIDGIINSIKNGGQGGITPSGINNDETGGTLLVRTLVKNKAKGVMLTVPDAFDFPYFTHITNEKIKNLKGVVIRVQRSFGSEIYRDFDPAIDKLIPTPTVEKLMRGEIKGLAALSDEDVVSAAEGNNEWTDASPIYYNQLVIRNKAKEVNIPVADIYGLYKKITAGSYTTDDGVKVDADWIKGNFFSADGIYPTAFGQAVIANEVIKTINQHYKLTIPLVETRFFLKK
jgi:hypothetical protein